MVCDAAATVSEGTAQTFHVLCREHSGAKRGLYGLTLWIVFETSMGIVRENIRHMSQLGKTMLRVALGALAVLMVPLVASQVVEGWNWDARSFVFVYVLFFLTGMVMARVATRTGVWSYKAGVGLALVAVTLPSGAPPHMARRMAIGHGVYTALFTASGLLFRHASLAGLR